MYRYMFIFRVVAAQFVGNWAEKRRFCGFSPSADRTWRVFW